MLGSYGTHETIAAMNGTRRIPIPWNQRWRRFRHGLLPMLGFAACVVGTFWLWGRQGVLPNATGGVSVNAPVSLDKPGETVGSNGR